MQILNLINKEKSEIEYVIDKFPDGQINIHLNNINRKDGNIGIVCRISSNDDIIMMMLVNDILQRQEIQVEYIYITYLLTARMDRVMDINQPYSLKIVSNIINSFKAKNVFVQEAHSEKTFNLIENSHPACEAFDPSGSPLFLKELGPVNIQYIFPDAGASKRYNVKEALRCNRPAISYDKMPYFLDIDISCTKKRNPETNELSGFEFTNKNKVSDKTDVIIVRDDLCDGGGTFMGVGELIKNYVNTIFINKEKPKIILVITHMIQAKYAISKLLTIYDEVWFTNSYKNWEVEINEDYFDDKDYYKRIKIFDVISYNINQLLSGKEHTIMSW